MFANSLSFFSLSSSTVLIFHIFIFPLIWSLARLPFVVLPTPLGCDSFSFIHIWEEIIFETVLCGSVDFLFEFFFFFFFPLVFFFFFFF